MSSSMSMASPESLAPFQYAEAPPTDLSCFCNGSIAFVLLAALAPCPLGAAILFLTGYPELAVEALKKTYLSLFVLPYFIAISNRGFSILRKEFPKRAAFVELDEGILTITRPNETREYRIEDCSWYVDSPTEDTALREALTFSMSITRRIIIECPEWSGMRPFERNKQRVAVGWSKETRNEWERILKALRIPKGRARSARKSHHKSSNVRRNVPDGS